MGHGTAGHGTFQSLASRVSKSRVNNYIFERFHWFYITVRRPIETGGHHRNIVILQSPKVGVWHDVIALEGAFQVVEW